MPFPLLDLPRELRDQIYEEISDPYRNSKRELPCFLVTCHQVYNEMQPIVQRWTTWGPNRIVISPSYPVALQSVSGPRRSRRARKQGGYAPYDVRVLSHLNVDLEYHRFIDNPGVKRIRYGALDFASPTDIDALSEPQEGCSATDALHNDASLEIERWGNRIPPTQLVLEDIHETQINCAHRTLQASLSGLYLGLHSRTRPISLRLNIRALGDDLEDFSPRGCFKRGIFQHLRAFTTLSSYCELEGIPILRDGLRPQVAQEAKHSLAVVEWFNKRRARWLSRQKFRTRQNDFLWDIRTLFGNATIFTAPPVMENPSIDCWDCGMVFPSNNELHKYLRVYTNKGYTPPGAEIEPEKDADYYCIWWYGVFYDKFYTEYYKGFHYKYSPPIHEKDPGIKAEIGTVDDSMSGDRPTLSTLQTGLR